MSLKFLKIYRFKNQSAFDIIKVILQARRRLAAFLFLLPLNSHSEGLVLGDDHVALDKKKTEAPLQPRWQACQGQTPFQETELGAYEESAPDPPTQSAFCFDCKSTRLSQFSSLKESSSALNEELFAQKLKARVRGQIKAKIFQTRLLKACVAGDGQWFEQLNSQNEFPSLDPNNIKERCKTKKEELLASIGRLWPEMRARLALATTPLRNEEIIRLPLKQTPSHPSSLFDDMPPLSPEEERLARALYADHLMPVFSTAPLQNISHSELREEIIQGQSLVEDRGVKRDEKFLTIQEHSHFRAPIRGALMDLRRLSLQKYFEIMTNMPLLGWLKNANPNEEELGSAFEKIEEDLTNFLEKIEDTDNNGILFSFEPLVEELLRENPNWCQIAEKQKQKAETAYDRRQMAFLGAVVISAVPCFLSGPAGLPLCLAGGLATGYAGYSQARSSMDEAFGRALTGKEFETIAGLSDKEKDAFVAKMLIPLAFWGTTAGTIKASLSLFSKKGASLSTQRAEHILGRSLNEAQKKAMREAYSSNSTDPIGLFKVAGFSDEEIQILIKEQLQRAEGASSMRRFLNPAQAISYGPILIRNFPASQVRHFANKQEKGQEGQNESH